MAIRYVGIETEEAKTPAKEPIRKAAEAAKTDHGAPAAEELPLGQATPPAKSRRKRG